jgi:hypothetical protein
VKKQELYVEAIEGALRALETAFVRANAAETIMPLMPLSHRWQLPDAEREAADQAEAASYAVTPDHWGARLALMSAFEALHAAQRIVASTATRDFPDASAWRDATDRAAEASRLAFEAERVLAAASR